MLFLLAKLELFSLHLGDELVSLLRCIDEINLLRLKRLNVHLLLANDRLRILDLVLERQ